MFLKDLDETVLQLRGRLRDYLCLKAPHPPEGKKKFRCFVHQDNSPSMCLNPKTNEETVHCFSCGATFDIFSAAHAIEGLPTSGPEWVKETIPHLCNLLSIEVKMGEPTLADTERAKQFKLAQDITDILVQAGDPTGYAASRTWEQHDVQYGSIDESVMFGKLVEQGWDPRDVARSLLVRTNTQSFFGTDKLTFVIRDERGRPIGFIYRNLTDKGSKYVNTPESLIYHKGKALMGLDTAVQSAKRDGLFVVEGPGDLVQLKRLGVQNSVATCGTALTADHLLSLKALGIRKVILCNDWDQAGIDATARVFFNVLREVQGLSVYVVGAPESGAKDPDEMLHGKDSAEPFLGLPRLQAFDWVITRLSDNETPDSICEKMVPLIASEPAAVKRELLMKKLAQHTELSYVSILQDVNFIRGGKAEERKERLLAAADQYRGEVEQDPENIIAIIGQHEQRIERIEKEYNRDIIGVGYQLQRYDAIQQTRDQEDSGGTSFKMGWFPGFAQAMNGGMSWAEGCLTYVGGRGNSGKTATCIMIGTDIAVHDDDTIVLMHYTDDSYRQTEPRIKSNIARMLHPNGPRLSLGMIDNPKANMATMPSEYWNVLREADDAFKGLLADERIVIIDSEDGSTMSTLEKQVRYYRQRHPSKKIMLICDNTHNYMDFLHLEQTQRITQIANLQKAMTGKYHCAMMATAEYRKNLPRDAKKMVLPVDDDLADARALIYRPNVIFHVYNDLHDRKDNSEIFYLDDAGERQPRLLLHFTKNKISPFKKNLVLDLDPATVTLKEYDESRAKSEASDFADAKDSGEVQVVGGQVLWMDTEYEEPEPTRTHTGPW